MQRRTFLSICSLALVNTKLSAEISRRHSWQQAASMPIKVQELYPTVHLNKLYVAGGIASKLGVPYFVASCFSYDAKEDKWSEEAELNENMHHAALVSSKQQLYQIGGFNGAYSHVWRMRANSYRLSQGRWVSAVNLPTPQAEGVLCTASDAAIHIVTGQSPIGDANRVRSDHTETRKHWRWDTSTHIWEPAAPIPTARNSASGGWIEDNLVIAGGRTASGNLAHTEIYDRQEDKLRTGAPMPLPQAGTASVIVGSRLIVLGGEIFVPESGVFANVWSYDINTDKWTPLPDLTTPRHGLGAGFINDKIFAIGGATEPSGNGTSDVNEVLNLG